MTSTHILEETPPLKRTPLLFPLLRSEIWDLEIWGESPPQAKILGFGGLKPFENHYFRVKQALKSAKIFRLRRTKTQGTIIIKEISKVLWRQKKIACGGPKVEKNPPPCYSPFFNKGGGFFSRIWVDRHNLGWTNKIENSFPESYINVKIFIS